MRSGPCAAALWVRLVAVVWASLVLGVAAHAAGAGVVPRPGAMLLGAETLVVVVGGILVAGRSVGRWASRWGRADAVQDTAAVLALVAGQALVHVLASPVDPTGTVALRGGAHHLHVAVGVMPEPMTGSTHQAAAGMWAWHAAAAVGVGLLLRRLERAVLALAAFAAHVASLVRARLGAVRRTVPAWSLPDPGDVPARACTIPDLRTRFRAVLLPLARRGPPHGPALA